MNNETADWLMTSMILAATILVTFGTVFVTWSDDEKPPRSDWVQVETPSFAPEGAACGYYKARTYGIVCFP